MLQTKQKNLSDSEGRESSNNASDESSGENVKKQEINIKNFAKESEGYTFLRGLFHSSKKRCVICKKTFQNDEKLATHFQKCDLLNPIINCQLNPDVYIFRNDGLDDISCEFPDCSYITPYKQNYNKHIIQEHTKSFLYRCYVCERGFVDKYDKITHNCQRQKKQLIDKTMPSSDDKKSPNVEKKNTSPAHEHSIINQNSTPQLLLERVNSSVHIEQSISSDTEAKLQSLQKQLSKTSLPHSVQKIVIEENRSISDNEITKSSAQEIRNKKHNKSLFKSHMRVVLNKSQSDIEDEAPKAKVKKYNSDEALFSPVKSPLNINKSPKNTAKFGNLTLTNNVLDGSRKQVKSHEPEKLIKKVAPVAVKTEPRDSAEEIKGFAVTETNKVESNTEKNSPNVSREEINPRVTSTPISDNHSNDNFNLTQHEKTMQFATKLNYEQVNKNNKSLICYYPDCEYKTRYQVNFLRHCVAKHKMRQPFNCSECGQGFLSTTMKNKHVKLVHHSKLENGFSADEGREQIQIDDPVETDSATAQPSVNGQTEGLVPTTADLVTESTAPIVNNGKNESLPSNVNSLKTAADETNDDLTTNKQNNINKTREILSPKDVELPKRIKGMYLCEICTYKVCSGERYRSHVWRHIIDGKHKCQDCGIKFYNKDKLHRHRGRCKSKIRNPAAITEPVQTEPEIEEFDILSLSWEDSLDIEYLNLFAPPAILNLPNESQIPNQRKLTNGVSNSHHRGQKRKYTELGK